MLHFTHSYRKMNFYDRCYKKDFYTIVTNDCIHEVSKVDSSASIAHCAENNHFTHGIPYRKVSFNDLCEKKAFYTVVKVAKVYTSGIDQNNRPMQ